MAKKSTFFCTSCGHETQGWLGKCPGCGEWNSLVEDKTVTGSKTSAKKATHRGWLETQIQEAHNDTAARQGNLLSLEDIEKQLEKRTLSGIPELDRVLGGGFVQGSLILVGGDPGIGKSTLLLQMAQNVKLDGTILYVCGEESPAQIKLRANRLGVKRTCIKLLPETNFGKIAHAMLVAKPELVIIDSIQTMYDEEISSAPGSVSQVRECTAGFLRIAKATGTTVVLVGHVTKDGAIAGPRVLEHMVDTVLYFEGENHHQLRIVRGVKNRYGATNEIGIFAMEQSGLMPLPNPSEILLAGRPRNTPGTVITATNEGTRTLLLEVQSLLVASSYGNPQRMTQGYDRNRLAMLIAVGDKYLKATFDSMDAYVNIIGGMKLNDPGTDLAILCSLFSSVKEVPIPEDMLLLGEIGLVGELRQVSSVEQRLTEAVRLGFRQIILPSANHTVKKGMAMPDDIDLIFVDNLHQAMDVIFSKSFQKTKNKAGRTHEN